MRVLMVGLNYEPEVSGIAPYTSGIAKGLVDRGIDLRVITSYPHYPAWRVHSGYEGSVRHERIAGVDVTRFRISPPSNPSGLRRLWFELKFGFRSAVARWDSPDIVVLVSPALFATAVAQARARLSRKRPKIVVWVQDIYSAGVAETGALGSSGANVVRRIESHVLRIADKVLVIHPRFKDVLVSKLGVETDRVRVIRNWSHLEIVESDRILARTARRWHDDEIIVLHAGNMGAKQALENVVDAARLADREASNVRFVLLGNGNQQAELKTRASGIARIEFLDSLEDSAFQEAIRAADILLVNEKPGVTEMAVPSKLTSYFSTGRPVLAATDPGSITAEEILLSGGGLRIVAGSPSELLRAATELGADHEAQTQYGLAGLTFRNSVLSESFAVEQFVKLLDSLVLAVQPR